MFLSSNHTLLITLSEGENHINLDAFPAWTSLKFSHWSRSCSCSCENQQTGIWKNQTCSKGWTTAIWERRKFCADEWQKPFFRGSWMRIHINLVDLCQRARAGPLNILISSWIVIISCISMTKVSDISRTLEWAAKRDKFRNISENIVSASAQAWVSSCLTKNYWKTVNLNCYLSSNATLSKKNLQ